MRLAFQNAAPKDIKKAVYSPLLRSWPVPPLSPMKLVQDHLWVYKFSSVCHRQLEDAWKKVLKIYYVAPTNKASVA